MTDRLTNGWTATNGNSAIVEPVHRGDTTVAVSVYEGNDGPSVGLTPHQARAMAAALTEAADSIGDGR